MSENPGVGRDWNTTGPQAEIAVTSEELALILAALDQAAGECERWAQANIDRQDNQSTANEYRLLSDRLYTRRERAK